MSNSLLLIGAAAVGGYLLFREQIDAALSGEQQVPRILPNGTVQTMPAPFPVPVTPPPSWVVGNWYWVQGSGRQFTITADGQVTLLNNGRTSQGTYNNGVIFIDGNSSPVTQNGSYLRTVNQTTGEVSDYTQTPTAPVYTTPAPNYPTVTYPSNPSPQTTPIPTYPTYPTGGGGTAGTGGCLLSPCEPEIFI